MVKDQLRQLIGSALLGASSRDALFAALSGADKLDRVDAAGADADVAGVDAQRVDADVAQAAAAPVADLEPVAAAEDAAPAPTAADGKTDADVDATLTQQILTGESDLTLTSPSIESLRTILDSVKDAILTVDDSGHVLGSNFAAARLFAESAIWLRAQSIRELLPALGSMDRSLATIAGNLDDTGIDLSPDLVEARRADGSCFQAEVTVSRITQNNEASFVLCIRDVTDRLEQMQAIGESEARYRALVENAPEAIIVLDVTENRFVDANENACKLFKLSREELLEVGPAAISPEYQFDGLPSFGLQRGHVERALKGGCPVFEWLHCDAEGREIPCEVRFIRLPSSSRRLIRASVIDIAARRRADAIAFGERKALELIAENADLELSFKSVIALAEQLEPDAHAAIMLLNDAGDTLSLAAAETLPSALAEELASVPLGLSVGACASAVSMRRPVIVSNIEVDPISREIADIALQCGMHAVFSTPIVASAERILGTLALYFKTPRSPKTDELDLAARLAQLIGIAIKRKQDETALRDSESRYRGLFDNVVDGVFQISPDEQVLSANPSLIELLGYTSLAELSACRMSDFCVDVRARERLNEELAAHGRVRNFEYRLRRSNGDIVVVLENSRAVVDQDGRTLYVEGTITDITQRKAAEKALFKEKERAQVTLQSIGDAVVTTDADGFVDYLNPVAEQLAGWGRRQAEGKRIDEVIRLRDELTGEPLGDPVLRCLGENRAVTMAENAVLLSRDGSAVAIQDSAAPIQDRHGHVVGAVMVFHDVSQERQLHRKLSYYATHDSLTGLINRREFEEQLSAALTVAKGRKPRNGALLLMDLDQFKVVNDTCGHAAGDLLLRQLAEVLQTRVRSEDILARLGGDEFAVLLEDCPLERASDVADQLREAISAFKFKWRDRTMQVGVSIGIVPVNLNSVSVASLMSSADVACYVAKDHGRNRVHIYEEGDASERHQEMQWVERINTARDQNRLELFFQPIVPITARVAASVDGKSDASPDPKAAADGPKTNVDADADADYPQFELLLRMRANDGELIAPNAFIPAAERYNLMPSLDRWVVDEVLQELVYRERSGRDPYMLALNLSGTTLSDARFLDYLLAELKNAAVPEGALCFEITETAAIANLSAVVGFMRALKEHGCRFSLDDFGSGLSSLTYLKNLPVDYVKIDGQFIRNVIRDKSDESVVDAIARMAHALRIKTIAERVESRAVFQRLGKIGISYAQGYFIAVPQPVKDLPVRTVPREPEAQPA